LSCESEQVSKGSYLAFCARLIALSN
jgi:hypothetical protein